MIIIMKRMCRKNYRKIVQKKIIGTINKSKNNKSYNDKNINDIDAIDTNRNDNSNDENDDAYD